MNMTQLLPEIFLSIMALALFGLSLGKPSRGAVGAMALVLSALALGGAAAAFGQQGLLFFDAYKLDTLSQTFKILITLGLFLVILAAPGLRGIDEKLHAEYYMFLAVGALGLVMLVSSHELLTIVLNLEISAFALNVIIPFRSMNTRRSQMEAAIKYFLFGVICTGVMLYGISYVFGMANTPYLGELAKTVPALIHREPLAVIGMIMMFCGFFFKLSLFPMHFLTPDVYEGSANETTSYIATLPKIAAIAVLIRLVNLTGHQSTQLTWLLATFAVCSMTFGNLSALVQSDLKRLLAYSSIAHAGYVMLGILSANELGFASAIYYMAGYLLMNLSCFYVIYQLAPNGENLTFDHLRGLYRRAPLLAFALATGAFGMTGIPPTIGFTGKFLIFTAAINKGFYSLVIIAVINTALSVFYYLKMVRAAYMPAADIEGGNVALTLPATALGLFFIVSIILTGIAPQGLIDLAKQAVAGML